MFFFTNAITNNKKIIVENLALLFVSIIVGIIVSGVAQILIIAAQNFFQLLFLINHLNIKSSFKIWNMEEVTIR